MAPGITARHLTGSVALLVQALVFLLFFLSGGENRTGHELRYVNSPRLSLVC